MNETKTLFSGEVESILSHSEAQIKKLSNSVLLNQTQLLVQAERRIGVGILNRLKEINTRKIYLDLGYSTLFQYLVGEIKYPEANAFRLIQPLKVMTVIPEVEQKIESGALSLSSISQAKSYMNAQLKQNGIEFTVEEQKEIFQAIEGQSTREAEKILASLHPDQPLKALGDNERPIAKDQTLIQFIANDELIELLKRVKDLDAHRNWNPTYAELLQMLANFYLDKKDPLRKVKKEAMKEQESELQSKNLEKSIDKLAAGSQDQPNALSALKVNKRSRYIRAEVKRQVIQESQGQCTFVSKITGKRCSETRGLQYEHCQPFALGGSNDISNLKSYCFHHNQWAREKIFGARAPLQ